MTQLTHGISITIERHSNDDFFMAFTAVGKLTHQDYEAMIPLLESALAEVDDPDIYALVDIQHLEGMELQAAWDDLKWGMKHLRHFEKIAIVGKSTWQEVMAKVADWITPADVRFFVDKVDALEWLTDD